MNKRPSKRTVLTCTLYTLVIFFVLAGLQFWIAFSQIDTSIAARRDKVLLGEKYTDNLIQTVLTSKSERLISDLLYLRDTLTGSNTAALTENWADFAGRLKIFSYIRFIDTNGQEQLRVDYNGKTASVTTTLHNASTNTQFKKAMTLPQNQIYISNILNGNEGPLISFTAPCFAADGSRTGVLEIEYLADDLFNVIKDSAKASLGSVYLLDSDSDILFESDGTTGSAAFAANYPAEWQQIQAGGSDTLITSNAAYTYVRFSPNSLSVDGAGAVAASSLSELTIVSRIAEGVPGVGSIVWGNKRIAQYILEKNIYIYVLILIGSGFLSWYLYNMQEKKRKLRFYSEYDAMTGALNRRAGLARLEKLSETTQPVVCFIDINGLKYVNDTLGHESGDEMIKTLASTILANIRRDDFLARLGGDEFLIVFNKTNEAAAQAVWTRIQQALEAVNNKENRLYSMSASHGIVQKGKRETVEETVARADSLMYEEKKEMKATREPESE